MADRPVDGGWKQRLKFVAFAVIPAASVLLVAHVIASVASYRRLEFIQDPLTGMTSYHMRVGGWPWVRPTVTRLNSRGFPDVEYTTLPAKGDCVHIVFTGDSFTFGDAVDGEKAWVSLVRDRLAMTFPGRCTRVFNIAAPMTTIEQQLARVRETRTLLQPDFVVLGQYQNDITDLTIPGSVAYKEDTETAETTFWGDRLRRMTPGFDFPLLRVLTYRTLKVFGERGIQYDLLRRWSVLADSTTADLAATLTGIYRTMYDSLVTELRADSVPMAVVIFPSRMDIIAKRYPEGAFFEALADDYDVPRLSLMPVLEQRRRPFPYLTYDGHFNELGNRIAAETVADWLLGASSPFPGLRDRLGAPTMPARVRWWPQPINPDTASQATGATK
jgi:hypothetical protein